MVSDSKSTVTERIGILGGTFDPIHVAHLALGVAARDQLQLDRVLFEVANFPWQKVGSRRISLASDRFDVVAAAVANQPGFEASRLEIDRGGESFTIDTLLELTAPGRELFLIIGSDLVGDLTTWKRWQEISELCTLAIAHRGGFDAEAELGPRWRSLSVRLPALELSSTELRTMIRERRSADYLVPEMALQLIMDRNLYRDTAHE